MNDAGLSISPQAGGLPQRAPGLWRRRAALEKWRLGGMDSRDFFPLYSGDHLPLHGHWTGLGWTGWDWIGHWTGHWQHSDLLACGADFSLGGGSMSACAAHGTYQGNGQSVLSNAMTSAQRHRAEGRFASEVQCRYNP